MITFKTNKMKNKIAEKFLIDFDKLEVGQKLWCTKYGEVEIIVLKDNERTDYTIRVNTGTGYTKDGKYEKCDLLPTLFLSCPYEQEERMVLVSNYEDFDEPLERVLIKIKSNKAICWNVAKTLEDAKSVTRTTAWDYYKEIEPKQKLTKDEFKTKFGIDFDQIEIINQ